MILITGSNGFLGQHVRHLLEEIGQPFIGLVKRRSVEPDHEEFTTLDDVLKSIHSIEAVIHLAAYIPYGSMDLADEQLYTTNIRLTGQLKEAFPGARIILASSVAVYGQPVQLPLTVNSAYNQPGRYGLSKLAAEGIILQHHSYSIIRFSSIIGAGMKSVSMVPRMINAAKEYGFITILGNGARKQNYIDVRDAAGICIACAVNQENMTILGVGEKSYSNLEIGEKIASLTGAKLRFEGADSNPSFIYDSGEAFDTIGFSHLYPVETTLREMVAFA